jgi:hypothetical protein
MACHIFRCVDLKRKFSFSLPSNVLGQWRCCKDVRTRFCPRTKSAILRQRQKSAALNIKQFQAAASLEFFVEGDVTCTTLLVSSGRIVRHQRKQQFIHAFENASLNVAAAARFSLCYFDTDMNTERSRKLCLVSPG